MHFDKVCFRQVSLRENIRTALLLLDDMEDSAAQRKDGPKEGSKQLPVIRRADPPAVLEMRHVAHPSSGTLKQ